MPAFFYSTAFDKENRMKTRLFLMLFLLTFTLSARGFEPRVVVNSDVVEIYTNDIQHARGELAMNWSRDKSTIINISPVPEEPLKELLSHYAINSPQPPEPTFDRINGKTITEAYLKAQAFYAKIMKKSDAKKAIALEKHPERVSCNCALIEEMIGFPEWKNLSLDERMWRLTWCHAIVTRKWRENTTFRFLGETAKK
jgi:hypothetical protein